MSALFSELKMRGLTLPNRIVISPMCQYCVVNGEAAAWHMIHLGSLALSGAGLLTIEATAVEPEGRITPGDLGLWNDATEDALKPILSAIRKYSRIPVAMQLAHAGRKASSHVPWHGGAQIPLTEGGWLAFAPSAIPQRANELAPIALDSAGLGRIRDAFGAAAQRASRLGIDALELHAAHGYLIHEFLSPISNRRDDGYGGSLENRMRFPIEIFETVRDAFPSERPVGVRVSATDWIEDGWDIEQTVVFVRELQKRGVDWIDASSGGISPAQKIPVGPGYQVPLAEKIRADTGVITTTVGQITDVHQAEEIIAKDKANLVALARGMLYDPRWPWHAAAELGATVEGPPQYWRAPPYEYKELFGKIVNGSR